MKLMSCVIRENLVSLQSLNHIYGTGDIAKETLQSQV